VTAPRVLGHRAAFSVTVEAAGGNVSRAEVRIVQGNRPLVVSRQEATLGRRVEIPIAYDSAPAGLREGGATIEVWARDDYWRPLRPTDRAVVAVPVTIDLTPPRLEVLAATRYLSPGGAALVAFKVTDAARIEVRVGGRVFPSFAYGPPDRGVRVALIALPYDFAPGTPMTVAAQDEAGNAASRGVPGELRPRRDDLALNSCSCHLMIRPETYDLGAMAFPGRGNERLQQLRRFADHFSQPIKRYTKRRLIAVVRCVHHAVEHFDHGGRDARAAREFLPCRSVMVKIAGQECVNLGGEIRFRRSQRRAYDFLKPAGQNAPVAQQLIVAHEEPLPSSARQLSLEIAANIHEQGMGARKTVSLAKGRGHFQRIAHWKNDRRLDLEAIEQRQPQRQQTSDPRILHDEQAANGEILADLVHQLIFRFQRSVGIEPAIR
jgi:hypothetical protein